MVAGPGFTAVFGGNNIAQANPSYTALAIGVNTVLGWPTELTAAGLPVVAKIIDITATVPGLVLQLSDARQVSTGYCTLINNVGVNTLSVEDSAGNVLFAPTSGQVWQLYLIDNSTAAGTWRVFQFGAGVSTANAASLAGAGLKAIGTTLNETISINQQSANYVIGSGPVADRAACIEWTGGSGGVFTLPNPAAVGSGWFCFVQNSGTGTVTITPPTGTINLAASLVLQPLDSAIIVTDGANFLTIGLGRSITSTFNFVQISLAGGTGVIPLTGAQLNRISYRFIGALAGNTTIQVPGSIQQYWVDNETTGAFTLTFSSAGGGSTTAVAQGNKAILYCDATNVVNAVTIPAVAAGGTTTQVQYNNAGAFAGSLMTYQAGTGQFSIPASSSGPTLSLGGSLSNGLFSTNLSATAGWSVGPGLTGATGGSGAFFFNDAPSFLNLGLTASGYVGPLVAGGPSGQQLYFGTAAGLPMTFYTSNTARLILGSAGNIVANAASAGVTFTAFGVANSAIANFNSASLAAASIPDLQVTRAGSTINQLSAGPNINLFDTVGGFSSCWQQSGGQTELWQFGSSVWNQILKVAVSGKFIINPPRIDDVLDLTTPSGPYSLVRGHSTGGFPVFANLDADFSKTGGGVAVFTNSNYPGIGAAPQTWVRVVVQGIGTGWMPVWF